MALILIFTNFLLTIFALYCWKKYQDKNFILISIFGLMALFIGALSYLERVPLSYSVISLPLHAVIINWYSWKKFKESYFFRYSLLSIILALTGIYGLFVIKINLSIPIQQWPLSSYVFLVVVIGAVVGFLI